MTSNPITSPLTAFFERDITTFIEELRAVPEENLWTVPDGVKNSAGALAQHVAGNLNHFIGHALGETGYVRDREQEFTNTGKNREELATALERTREMVAGVLPGLNDETLAKPFPIDIPFDLNTFGMLLQIHHHLSYHLGQLTYLRRMMDGGLEPTAR